MLPGRRTKITPRLLDETVRECGFSAWFFLEIGLEMGSPAFLSLAEKFSQGNEFKERKLALN